MIRQAPPTDRGTDWRDLGLCRQLDAEVFFPDGDGPRYTEQVDAAKAICRACPVLASCRQWALDRRELHGVWGGLSARERISILRRRGQGTGQPRTGRAAA